MANNLYPIIYKSGIKRDGTLFQSDYCTDGQWIRFQRGAVRKMGGMKIYNRAEALNQVNVSNITMIPTAGDGAAIFLYIAPSTGAISRVIITPDFSFRRSHKVVYQIPEVEGGYLWKSQLALQGGNQQMVYLGAPSFQNINTAADSVLLFGRLGEQIRPSGKPPKQLAGASGILFVNPYLFVYGSNGLLQWSKRTDITDFTGADNSISISYDKIIDVRSIRGGINSPTLLCWTLTSVVRAINIGNAESLNFQLDVLSKTSSILSSRCVVEYDGLFFWPGTNRFFQFNGIVQELPNTMNLNYFFKNLDMNNRQLVFGVKNTQYGEIWWFYPTKGQPNPVRNNRAIIYNIRENAWYDTEISRDAGVYSEDFGFMATYGKSLTDPDNVALGLYRHEYETFSADKAAIQELVPSDGNQVRGNPIISSVTTPTISWAAFNPLRQLTGVDRWMELVTIEPDFTLMPPPDRANFNFFGTDMKVIVNSREYAQSAPASSAPYQILSPLRDDMDPILAKVDIAYQGRHISLTFTTTDNFEMGHIMVLLGIGDGQ